MDAPSREPVAETPSSEPTTSDTTRELPDLPERLTRWTVDRHYTALVDVLRQGGAPGPVAEQAHEVLVSQVRAGYPNDAVPDYVLRLGQTDIQTPATPSEAP